MRLICPNCQQAVTVSDTAAGQSTPCPQCGKPFTPPALTGAAIDAAPAPASTPPPAPPRQREAEVPRAPAPAAPTTSLDMAGTPCCRLTLRRNVVPWLVPGALLIAFFLTFFPWVGVYPNGTLIYDQTAWRAASGSVKPVDALGESVLKWEGKLSNNSRWNGWLMFYVLLLIPAVLVAWAERAVPWLGGEVPNAVRPIWPYRQLILASICAGLCFLLLGALLFGFGLETAAARAAEEAFPPPVPAADGTPPTTPQIQTRNVRRDVELASYGVSRTYWLVLAFDAHLIALIGAGLALWLESQPNRPEPRIECYC